MCNKKKLDFITDEKGCFICISHKPNSYGYPQIKHNKEQYRAHRFIYEQCFGEIKKGMVIRHTCDNPMCINPEHLTEGTVRENNNDMFERGRNPKGNRHGNARLKENDIPRIKSLINKGFSLGKIAKIYNVGKTTIANVKYKNTWAHVVEKENEK